METLFKQSDAPKSHQWYVIAKHRDEGCLQVTLSDDWMGSPSHNVSAPNLMYINVLMHPNIDKVSELFSAEFSLYLLLLIDLGQPRSSALIWTVYTFLISHFFSYWRKDWENGNLSQWKQSLLLSIWSGLHLQQKQEKNVLQYQNIEVRRKISFAVQKPLPVFQWSPSLPSSWFSVMTRSI